MASPGTDSPLPEGTVTLGGAEAIRLKADVAQGNLGSLREYLARTRIEGDWQDRIFMLELVVHRVSMNVLDQAIETEPNAADLALIHSAYLSELALTQRGGGTCEQVGEDNWKAAEETTMAAVSALDRAAQLDPQDPTGHAYILRPLNMFGQLMPRMQAAFRRATELAPGLVPAHRVIVTALSERWHGSHEQSVQFARKAMSSAGRESDMAF
jgi:hypothetical protein